MTACVAVNPRQLDSGRFPWQGGPGGHRPAGGAALAPPATWSPTVQRGGDGVCAGAGAASDVKGGRYGKRLDCGLPDPLLVHLGQDRGRSLSLKND